MPCIAVSSHTQSRLTTPSQISPCRGTPSPTESCPTQPCRVTPRLTGPCPGSPYHVEPDLAVSWLPQPRCSPDHAHSNRSMPWPGSPYLSSVHAVPLLIPSRLTRTCPAQPRHTLAWIPAPHRARSHPTSSCQGRTDPTLPNPNPPPLTRSSPASVQAGPHLTLSDPTKPNPA